MTTKKKELPSEFHMVLEFAAKAAVAAATKAVESEHPSLTDDEKVHIIGPVAAALISKLTTGALTVNLVYK